MFALEDEEGRSAIAARGCEFVMKSFSMARMVKAVEKLYDELYTMPRRAKSSGSKA
jgi:hypothetical protein